MDSLPSEVLIHIFKFLETNELGQIARVSRSWSKLTKTPFLWQKVNAKLFLPNELKQEVVIRFLDNLPPSVKTMNLEFISNLSSFERLQLEDIFQKLKEKCPSLHKLILKGGHFSSNAPLADIVLIFLQNVEILSLFYCSVKIDDKASRDTSFPFIFMNGKSNMKIFQLSSCDVSKISDTNLLYMNDLMEMRLHDTPAYDSWFISAISFLSRVKVLDLSMTKITSRAFEAIRNYAVNLEELYVCDTGLQDSDFIFNQQLPHLKSICLSYCGVTCVGVRSLFESCQSVEKVYLRKDLAYEFTESQDVAANIREIVQPISWQHNHGHYFVVQNI